MNIIVSIYLLVKYRLFVYFVLYIVWGIRDRDKNKRVYFLRSFFSCGLIK